MKPRIHFLAILFLVSSFIPQATRAQQSVTFATLSGRIEDTAGAGVTGATVAVVNLETGQSLTTQTEADGSYRFPCLRVGKYNFSVAAEGFSKVTRQLTASVGQALDLPVQLEVETVSAHVNVTSTIPLVETVRTQVTETIDPEEINDLPLNGHNFMDLALLVPAVSPTNTGGNQRFAETSAVPGQGLSIAGQRNIYNGFVVDGLSANDDAADLTGTYYSQEVIDQFQVITSGGIAEFGRASAGVVNILTKSGTNDWHGSMYGYFRNQRFDARNPLATTKDSLTQAQYGLSLSGPLRRDRTFFFSNFEQTRRNYSAVLTIAPSAVTTINNKLTSSNYPGSLISTGVVPASFDSTNFFVRLDHKLNASNQLNARYSVYHIEAANSRSVGGLNAVSRGTGLDNTDQTVLVGNTTLISKRTINEARFQFTNSDLKAPVNDVIGPAVGIAGVANFGIATVSPLARKIQLFELVDNVTTVRERHSIKAGVDVLHNKVDILFPGALQGVYAFNSLNAFLAGNYSSFQQAFGVPNQSQSNPNLGLFVQDEWRVSPALTLNAGLRYDVQFLPDPIQTDTNNFGPRLGIAYAPGDHKTVIRGNVGIFFDRIPLRATSNALQRDGSKYVVVQLQPGQPGAPTFPHVLSFQPSALPTKPNITRIDPNIETSYSEQASLQIERELPGSLVLSLGYIHLRGLHLILSRNINVPTVPSSAGIPNLGRPDPNWGNISRFESSGTSNYDGMVLSLNRRATSWANFRLSYTLSKTLDNSGNFFFSTVQNNFNINDDRGRSDNDQTHRLVLSGSFEAPRTSNADFTHKLLNGLQLGYIFTYASRLPFNVLLGSDRNFDTTNNDRPVGVGRNTGKGFDFASLDLRVAKRFHVSERVDLSLIAEGFNVLNRSNFGVPNNTFGPNVLPLPSFGQPTAAFDPRQFQFGLKLTF
jgi:hypothetical protein